MNLFRRPAVSVSFVAAIFISAVAPNAGSAADESGWQQSKEYADAGKYADALKVVGEHPSEEPAFYYNIGSLELQLGSSGLAVAHLEKAHSLAPSNGLIGHNLTLARAALAHSIGEAHLDPSSTWIEQLHEQIPLMPICGGLCLASIALTLVWIRIYRGNRSFHLSLTHPVALLALGGYFAASFLFAAERLDQSHPAAACLEAQVVRSGPGDQFLELGRLDAGSKVRILSFDFSGQPGWRQVRFGPERIGWMKNSSMLLL